MVYTHSICSIWEAVASDVLRIRGFSIGSWSGSLSTQILHATRICEATGHDLCNCYNIARWDIGGPKLGPPWFHTAPKSTIYGLPHNVGWMCVNWGAGGPDLLRSCLSVAILVQCSSRCFAVVFAMAMSKASATAEVASATAVKLFTAEMIREHADRSDNQPHSRSNEALKHFRDLLELFLQPVAIESSNLDLEADVLPIRKSIHDRGEDRGAEFHFSRGDDTVLWSWSQMLLGTGLRFEEVVGDGVVAVKVIARPGSFDSKRAEAWVRHGGQRCVHLPIWDFLVVRADGTGILLHPRWRWHPQTGIEILPFARSPPRCVAHSSRAKASPPLPGIASDSDFSQPSDTELPQLPTFLQRLSSQLPQPPPAPAIVGKGDAHPSSSGSVYNKMGRPSREVPATAGVSYCIREYWLGALDA